MKRLWGDGDPVLIAKYNANRNRKYWRTRELKRDKGSRWQRVVKAFAFHHADATCSRRLS